MMKPFPTLDEILQIVLQEEKQREIVTPSPISLESSAMLSNRQLPIGRGRGYYNPSAGRGRGFTPHSDSQGRGRPLLYCEHCKMNGHTIHKCYKLHGYPSSSANRKIVAAVGEKSLTDAQFFKLVQMLEKDSSSTDGAGPSSSSMAGMVTCLLAKVVTH